MVEKGCRAVCIGLGIHYPYYINTGFSPGTTANPDYFSPVQREYFHDYLETALLPAVTCALEWLDTGNRCSFSISGLVLEQLREDDTGACELLVQAMQHRCSEILGQTYYHSVSGLFSDKSEFISQVTRHTALMEQVSGKKPKVFENTEFVFSSDLADIIRKLGFSALYSEGYDHLVSDIPPNALYSCRGLFVMLRNCRLSEDIAYRFFDQNWDRYPLTAETFATWVAATPGDCIHLFIDARTFSGPVQGSTGFREFFCQLPDAFSNNDVVPALPSESLQGPSRGDLQLEDLGLCSPDGTCSLTGIQNILQQSAFWCLEDGQHLIIDGEPWRKLQTTDHFIRMALRSGSCGRFVSSCTSQETWEYFSAYLRILGHLESAGTRLHRSRMAARALRCLPPEHAFHFSTEYHYTGYSAHSLTEFARLLEFVPDTVFLFHQNRGDFSQWITGMLGDTTLARRLEQCTGSAEAREIVEERVRELCRRLR